MKSWAYDIGDVLLIHRKEQEVVARVAGFVDQLDNTTALYCNLRTIDDNGWKRSEVKVMPKQIVKYLPHWYEEQTAKWKAELSASTDEIWAKMSDSQKRRVHREAVEFGIAQPVRRSGLDILIDRACGLEE